MAVKTGLARLAERGFRDLKGKRVGLVTHPAGILADKTSAIAAMRAGGINLIALFGPEHGVRGDVPAGKYIASYTDPQTKLPVYSLYGKTRQPTPQMLRGLDVLVFDLQDIGARSYTYLSTLGAVLTGCGIAKVPVLVLDRPNPVGLMAVEGGPTQPGFTSFISKYPVAYRHGMTLGEMAKYLVEERLVTTAHLTIEPCAGLTRGMTWKDMGLPWIPTSPNIPTPMAAALYHATGIAGELSTISIGIGTARPFGYFGAPGIDGVALAKELSRRDLGGLTVAPATWTPTKGTHAGKSCRGVQVGVANSAETLNRFNFEAMDALRRVAPALRLFTGKGEAQMFDFSCGTDTVRKAYLKNKPATELWSLFAAGLEGFASRRTKHLLYDE